MGFDGGTVDGGTHPGVAVLAAEAARLRQLAGEVAAVTAGLGPLRWLEWKSVASHGYANELEDCVREAAGVVRRLEDGAGALDRYALNLAADPAAGFGVFGQSGAF